MRVESELQTVLSVNGASSTGTGPLPLIILTFGIALFFINMAMFALTAWIVPGFDVGGFWSVVQGTIIIWIVNLIIDFAVGRVRGGAKDEA